MLIILLLIAAFNAGSGAPVPLSASSPDAVVNLTIFGRQVVDYSSIARYRTIQNIVWGCLTTIFACTWVAVHPNVPRPQDTGWMKIKQRVLITIYAILAPEFITMWALRQRVGAAKNMKEYNSKFYPNVTPPPRSISLFIKDWFRRAGDEKPDGLWTITHGFLLEMHGLTQDSGETVRSVRNGIPDPLDILEEEVNDKSKGDFLTKLVVVLQTTWFVFQCLSRWMAHLPVTELEVVTLAFALLNVATYVLWWNKPQNMHVAIPMHRHKRSQNPQATTEGNATQGTAPGPEAEREKRSAGEARVALELKAPQKNAHTPKSRFLDRALAFTKRSVNSLAALARMAVAFFEAHNPRSLKLMDVARFIVGPITPLAAMLSGGGQHSYVFYSSVDGVNGWETILPVCAVSIVFGGLHLIPLWSSSFPSAAERHLWQVSAIWITIQLFLLLCLRGLLDIDIVESHTALRCCIEVFSAFVMVIGCLLYVAARLILVVLAFTTLRKLPPDAFRNIAWTTFLPHY